MHFYGESQSEVFVKVKHKPVGNLRNETLSDVQERFQSWHLWKKYNPSVTWYSAPLCHRFLHMGFFPQNPVTFKERQWCDPLNTPKCQCTSLFLFLDPFPYVLTGLNMRQLWSELMLLHKWTHQQSLLVQEEMPYFSTRVSFFLLLSHLQTHMCWYKTTRSALTGVARNHKNIFFFCCCFFLTSCFGYIWEILEYRGYRIEKHITGGLSLRMKYICFNKNSSHIKLSSLLKLSRLFLTAGSYIPPGKINSFLGSKLWLLMPLKKLCQNDPICGGRSFSCSILTFLGGKKDALKIM